MKSDLELRTEVAAELLWDPAINSTNIGVAARDGVPHVAVHLAGERSDSLREHDAVIGTACAARGVSRVVDELRIGPWHRDSAIA